MGAKNDVYWFRILYRNNIGKNTFVVVRGQDERS